MKKMMSLLLPILFSVSAHASEGFGVPSFQASGQAFCGKGDSGNNCGAFIAMSSGTTFFPLVSVFTIGEESYNMSAGNMKVILAAQEDATYFIATEGDVVTAKLQQAVHAFRLHNPKLEWTDSEIVALIASL